MSFTSLMVIPFRDMIAALTSAVFLDFSSCGEVEVIKNHYVVETLSQRIPPDRASLLKTSSSPRLPSERLTTPDISQDKLSDWVPSAKRRFRRATCWSVMCERRGASC